MCEVKAGGGGVSKRIIFHIKYLLPEETERFPLTTGGKSPPHSKHRISLQNAEA